MGAFDRRCLLVCLAISAVLILWVTLASGSFNVRAAVVLVALPWMLLRAGGIITTLLCFPSFFALDFVVGVTVISTAVMVWKVLVPVSLWVLLIILLIAVAGMPRLLLRRQRASVSALELLAVVVSLAAATGWSQDLISPSRSIEGAVVFKPWSDFFFHATMLARSLGSQTLLQVGNYEWKGLPAFVYHYASYSLALCLAKAGDVPAYAAAVGFWAPFGSFLAGLSAYALGRVFWSQGAGLLSLAAVVLIPDLGLLNVAHPFYGYFWLQHVDPGGLYGVTIAGAALTFIVQGMRGGRRSWIVSGVMLGALVALFKVHIFAASFPIIFSLAILAWRPGQPRQWLLLGLCVAAALTGVQFANHFHIGPDVHFDFSGGVWYWKVLAGMAKGTPVESWYQVFSTGNPFPGHLAQAAGLLLLSALGIFAAAAPLAWFLAILRKNWQLSDGISVAAVAILLLMTFGLSRNTMLGLPEELIHRPFVWAYWLVGSLTAGRLFSLGAARRPMPSIWVVTLGFLVLLLVPAYYGRGLQRGKWPAASAHYNVHVDLGLVESARFIRKQLPTNAVVQDSHLEELFPILDGLSERGSFATRPKFWVRISKAFRESNYREQLRRLQALQSATNVPALQRNVHETGIRWYVVRPGDSYPWPNEFRDHPAFESHGYKVYDMLRCFDLRG